MRRGGETMRAAAGTGLRAEALPAGLAALAFLALPYAFTGGASGLGLALSGYWSLALAALCLLGAALAGMLRPAQGPVRAVLAGLGLGALFAVGFAEGLPVPPWGLGAALLAAALILLLARGCAAAGAFKADPWVATVTVTILALVLLFVFFPVARVLLGAFVDPAGRPDFALFLRRISAPDIWSAGCLLGTRECGVVLNTIWLGILTGILSTALGLAFALLATRGGIRHARLFDALSILPIITPPFVIALALIILFGRTGIVTSALDGCFGIGRSRWIYGLPGVLISQVLSQTPLSYLILRGAIRGIAPALEEAAQILGASRLRLFRTVTWPLLRPAVAAAFLLAFVESLSDFGNPLVLGGSFEVLSTKIFFAVAGAQHDPGRAAVLALILLALTLAAFWLQTVWLGRASYVTVTGKGDAGMPASLPSPVRALALGAVLPWLLLTVAVYGIIAAGGFVQDIGRGDMTLTWAHFHTGFEIEWRGQGLFLAGSAWDSFLVTLAVSAIAAPLTAAVGLLTAYVLARHDFAGRRIFEFLTLLSFAIPGTVIGVAYILAFNVPPIEITGTGLILILCFVFRNMPVGVRAGIAALAQIDRSLDEASTTLGARTGTTVRRVILPLLKPAIISTLVYSFVNAMTAVSAIVFLVTARFNMATAYIVNRVEAGEYPLAIAYSTLLILFMLAVVLLIQRVVGERKPGRLAAAPAGAPVTAR
ncbi:ABC transporter permease [Rhabdaerophilum calidifontis]|uniref:ABC transporter permease n=1 Tax=Rhabdaerophilum calidifontis TaxID=2604328 RepID=UPI001FE63293|nr:iron ABC transporter permease [Rhabdaerophilum calidifontis]